MWGSVDHLMEGHVHRQAPDHSQRSTISTVSCSDLMEENGLEIVSDVIVKLLTTCIILISDKVVRQCICPGVSK